MLTVKLTIGPPGCGKTRSATDRVATTLAGGISAAAVAVVTFTRAAATELLGRLKDALGLTRAELPWVRTIHSAAFRLLGLRRNTVMTDRSWAKFGERHGYDLSPTTRCGAGDPDEVPAELPRQTDADLLRYVYFWGRNRRLDIKATLAKTNVVTVRPDALELFVRRFNAFKADNDLVDFCDILERCLRTDSRPGVSTAFIDEAQDLSPLQIAIVEKWFAPCDAVFVYGDEDQAIYGFNGADPGWMLELARAEAPEILTQSHRVPAAPHEIARRIILRNKERLEKHYSPAPTAGTVLNLPQRDVLPLIDGSRTTFVLVRNRIFLGRYARYLITAKIPFIVEGGGAACPMAWNTATRAVDALARIAAGTTRLDVKDLAAILHFIPVGAEPFGIERGLKAEVQRRKGEIDLRGFGLGSIIDEVHELGIFAPLIKLPEGHREYFEALLLGRDSLPKSRVTLTTIHGAKGREAELVIVVPDMTRETYLAYTRGRAAEREAENRVFYVGATRTRETLVLVEPETKRYFDFPTILREGFDL